MCKSNLPNKQARICPANVLSPFPPQTATATPSRPSAGATRTATSATTTCCPGAPRTSGSRRHAAATARSCTRTWARARTRPTSPTGARTRRRPSSRRARARRTRTRPTTRPTTAGPAPSTTSRAASGPRRTGASLPRGLPRRRRHRRRGEVIPLALLLLVALLLLPPGERDEVEGRVGFGGRVLCGAGLIVLCVSHDDMFHDVL